MTMTIYASDRRTRMIYLVLATLALLLLGLIYAWSIFSVPIGAEFGWDRSSLQQVYAVSIAFFCFGALGGAGVSKRLAPRKTIIGAGVLLCAGFLLTVQLCDYGIVVFFTCYALLVGASCGIGYNTIISTVNLWFPDHPGLSAGILMMGFGLGSLVLGSPAALVLGAYGWRVVFSIIGIVGGVVLLLIGLLIKLPPNYLISHQPNPRSPRQDHTLNQTRELNQTRDVVERRARTKSRKALVSPVYYLYLIWGGLIIALNTTIGGDVRGGAESLGVDATVATLWVGLLSLASGIARPLAGLLYDHTSLRSAMLFANLNALICTTALALSFALELPMLYLAAAFFMGFTFGSIPVIASAFAREAFDIQDFPKNLALANISMALGSIICSVVVGVARDFGGGTTVYAIFIVLMVIALLDLRIFLKKSGL